MTPIYQNIELVVLILVLTCSKSQMHHREPRHLIILINTEACLFEFKIVVSLASLPPNGVTLSFGTINSGQP